MENKFSTIKERVVNFIEFKGVRKEIFFDKIGTTSANFRGIAKKTPLNSTVIENIFTEFPDLSLEWLLTGRGSMIRENLNQNVPKNTHAPQPLSALITASEGKDTTNNITAQENTLIIDKLLGRLENQSEEIGRLKAENKHLHNTIVELQVQLQSII